MKKNLLCMALALVMATGMLAGCGGNDGDVSSADNGSTRVWKFSHTRAEGTDNDIMANKFADSLTGAIDGLKIEMYPNNQLGDYTVVQEAVGLGEVQLMLGSMSNGVDPTLSVQIAPYLVNTWDEAYDWYNSTDGLMYHYVAERLEMQNIHLLAVMPKYFGAIMTTTPASNIDNPTANKSVKIRVPQMKSFEQFASAVGFQTTPLPTSDTFTALQTGVVNGSCGGAVLLGLRRTGKACILPSYPYGEPLALYEHGHMGQPFCGRTGNNHAACEGMGRRSVCACKRE